MQDRAHWSGADPEPNMQASRDLEEVTPTTTTANSLCSAL